MMKLQINPEVIEDIAEIKRYIREDLCNPDAADRIAQKIVSAYKELKTSPFIGAPLDSVLEVKTDYRFLVCGNYLIFYKIKDDTISIYRVMNYNMDGEVGNNWYCLRDNDLDIDIADDDEVFEVSKTIMERNREVYEKLK